MLTVLELRRCLLLFVTNEPLMITLQTAIFVTSLKENACPHCWANY